MLRFGENLCIAFGSREVQFFKTFFMFKVSGSRSNVGTGSDHDFAQLNHGRNMPCLNGCGVKSLCK